MTSTMHSVSEEAIHDFARKHNFHEWKLSQFELFVIIVHYEVEHQDDLQKIAEGAFPAGSRICETLGNIAMRLQSLAAESAQSLEHARALWMWTCKTISYEAVLKRNLPAATQKATLEELEHICHPRTYSIGLKEAIHALMEPKWPSP